MALDFAELYQKHRGDLVRLAASYLRDTAAAEDVVHEVFTGFLAAELRNPDAAIGYLTVSTKNRARDALRRRAAIADGEIPEPTHAGPSAEQVALERAERTAVIDALRTLPRQQRTALVLRYYGGLVEPEIAESMHISRGAVKSHVSRGKRRLAVDPQPSSVVVPPPVRRRPGRTREVTSRPAQYGLEQTVDRRARPGQPLTPIQVDILRRVADGVYDHEIARALEMSTRTFRRHLTAAQRKLGARTRPHAVALAITIGLIPITREDTP